MIKNGRTYGLTQIYRTLAKHGSSYFSKMPLIPHTCQKPSKSLYVDWQGMQSLNLREKS